MQGDIKNSEQYVIKYLVQEKPCLEPWIQFKNSQFFAFETIFFWDILRTLSSYSYFFVEVGIQSGVLSDNLTSHL